MIQLECKTTFDITATGVRGHYQSSRLPFTTSTGLLISTQTQWQQARNQQRNWETVNQIIALRCLPEHISAPVKNQQCWQFKFEIPNISSVATEHSATGYLEHDAQHVPMISGLGEVATDQVVLQPGVNIWFSVST